MGEIEREMSARELGDWLRYCAHQPLPMDLVDVHGGLLIATLCNINRAKDAAVVDPGDFMILRPKPKPDPTKPALTIAQRMKRVANGEAV